jgi:hypothetical protein
LLTGVQPLAQSTSEKLHHLRYEKLVKPPA